MDALSNTILATSSAKGSGVGQKHITEAMYEEMQKPKQEPLRGEEDDIVDLAESSDDEIGQSEAASALDSILAEIDMDHKVDTPKKKRPGLSAQQLSAHGSGKRAAASAFAESQSLSPSLKKRAGATLAASASAPSETQEDIDRKKRKMDPSAVLAGVGFPTFEERLASLVSRFTSVPLNRLLWATDKNKENLTNVAALRTDFTQLKKESGGVFQFSIISKY